MFQHYQLEAELRWCVSDVAEKSIVVSAAAAACPQMGTVVDDPLDNSNRLAKGQRRATLTEQLLVDAELTTSRKRRFNKLQVCRVCVDTRMALGGEAVGGRGWTDTSTTCRCVDTVFLHWRLRKAQYCDKVREQCIV